MGVKPYKGGDSHIPGMPDAVKLSSNENPLGPPPSAIRAARDALPDMHRYPSADHASLRRAIGNRYGLDPARIMCGAGSDEIITLLARALAGQGDEVIHSAHGFLMYQIAAQSVGASPVAVPERDRTSDVDALIAACTSRTRLLFLANPNNPTGTMLAAKDVARLAAAIPAHVLLVLDGAYAEYVDGFDGGAELVDAHANLFMMRTFSKIFGLGGMRVGWGYGSVDVIDMLNRIRGPFNLTSPALAAAEAALNDTDFLRRSRAANSEGRAMMTVALREAGVACDTSHANFVLARFASTASARACDRHFRKDGLIVRRVDNYGLPEALRITVGDKCACRRVADAVSNFAAGRGVAA